MRNERKLSFFFALLRPTVSLCACYLFGVLDIRRKEEIKARSNYSPNGTDRSLVDRTSEECYRKATNGKRCDVLPKRTGL